MTMGSKDQMSELQAMLHANSFSHDNLKSVRPTFNRDISNYTKNVKGDSYDGPYKDLKKMVMKIEADKMFNELIEDQIVNYFINKVKIQENASKKSIKWSSRLLSLWEIEKVLLKYNSPRELDKVRREAKALEITERAKHNEDLKRNIAKSDMLMKRVQVDEALEFWKDINKKLKKAEKNCVSN